RKLDDVARRKFPWLASQACGRERGPRSGSPGTFYDLHGSRPISITAGDSMEDVERLAARGPCVDRSRHEARDGLHFLAFEQRGDRACFVLIRVDHDVVAAARELLAGE